MSDERKDPLWDPALEQDAELESLQALRRFGAQARGLEQRVAVFQRPHRPRWRRAFVASIASAAAAIALVALGLQHRLAWTPGLAWQAETSIHGVEGTRWRVAPGDTVQSDAEQTVTIEIARIGQVVLSPGSKLQLLDTRPRHHRVRLEHGHMRARVWAPPGYFGVESDTAEVIDMGCEFELWKQADGRGRLLVHSGWVEIRVGGAEWIVPEGHAVRFDKDVASTPMRTDASKEFAQALAMLDLEMARNGSGSAQTRTAADRLARSATKADRFTLIILLSRHHALAQSALYPILARGLGAPESDAAHREAWLRGDSAAINAWWARVPRPPKQWWANWRDAFADSTVPAE